MSPSDASISIRELILDLCRVRGPEKSICPSEVARQLDPDRWRERMDDVRDVAAELVVEGLIEVAQKGEPIELAAARGPIRLRIKK